MFKNLPEVNTVNRSHRLPQLDKRVLHMLLGAVILGAAAAVPAARAQGTVTQPTPIPAPAPSSMTTTVVVPRSEVDALKGWWATSDNPAFLVEFVGQAAGQPAIVIRFSRDVGDPALASRYLRVLDDTGAPVAGNWTAGGVPTVLVHTGLTKGRYTVILDPRLTSAKGDPLNTLLAGTIYVQ